LLPARTLSLKVCVSIPLFSFFFCFLHAPSLCLFQQGVILFFWPWARSCFFFRCRLGYQIYASSLILTVQVIFFFLCCSHFCRFFEHSFLECAGFSWSPRSFASSHFFFSGFHLQRLCSFVPSRHFLSSHSIPRFSVDFEPFHPPFSFPSRPPFPLGPAGPLCTSLGLGFPVFPFFIPLSDCVSFLSDVFLFSCLFLPVVVFFLFFLSRSVEVGPLGRGVFFFFYEVQHVLSPITSSSSDRRAAFARSVSSPRLTFSYVDFLVFPVYQSLLFFFTLHLFPADGTPSRVWPGPSFRVGDFVPLNYTPSLCVGVPVFS